ncbi:unnamed protein product [Penicillium palitans]
MTLKSRLRLALRRKEKKPISHQPKTSKLQNGEIPAEILDLVYEQLPTLDQIYFALTCKYLYIYFVSFLKTMRNISSREKSVYQYATTPSSKHGLESSFYGNSKTNAGNAAWSV